MSDRDNTLTGARLVEAGARVLCPTGQTPFGVCNLVCGYCGGQARAALRAQAKAAGVTAEMLASADELLRLGHHGVIAAYLRALAEVLDRE